MSWVTAGLRLLPLPVGSGSGEAPPTLFEIPDNALVLIDESHVTILEMSGMYRGDRKEDLGGVWFSPAFGT